MPGPQWNTPDKRPPKHAPPACRIAVIGPDYYPDRELVWKRLYRYTDRMENVEVVTMGEHYVEKKYVEDGNTIGVTKFAVQWAEREWWPRFIIHTHLFGKWPSKFGTSVQAVVGTLKESPFPHCVAFWDGKCPITARLMEEIRDVIPLTNFKYRRV